MSVEQHQIQELLHKAYEMEQANQAQGEQYETLLRDISEKDPLNYIYVDKYATILSQTERLDQAQKVYEKALRYNTAQVELWKKFVNFSMEHHYFNNQEEDKTKQIFERAIDNAGQHMRAEEIWTKYIDFELSLNHMGLVNLLCYLSIKTPMMGTDELEKKYLEILDTLYDAIVDDIRSDSYQIGDKYKAKHDELVKLMFEDCKGDKFEFINKVKQIFHETKLRVNQRIAFEEKIMSIWQEGGSLEEEKEAWTEYINYEIQQQLPKRAKLLYERGLISLDRDRHFWISYVRFIERHLKDATLVRAKFENRLKHCDKYETIDIMIENALFEEEQLQVQKARKVYELLQNEIAPDYIKSLVAFINFERRQNNNEKVKELYFKAYQTSLSRNEIETMTYIVMQYARFLTFKCNDANRAVDILNQAITKAKGSKVLFLSYANFLKHLEGIIPDVYAKIVQVFDKAIDENQSGLSQGDRTEIARYYYEYMLENCQSVSVLRNTEQLLIEKRLLYETNIERLQGHTVGVQENGGHHKGSDSILGKRDKPEDNQLDHLAGNNKRTNI